jgi:beta-glucosidase
MRTQKRDALPLSLFGLTLLCTALCAMPANGQDKANPQDNDPKYRNPNLAIDDRVADLLSRMTLEEKVQQITGGGEGRSEVIDPTGTFNSEQARQTLSGWWDPDLAFTPRRAAILRNGVQRHLREKTRLGIPALFMVEALHGFMEYGSTSFPQALGLASTWDPQLVQQVFTAAGEEAGSAGAGQVFSPVLDIARDPRWGRTEEIYGEDPFLASRMDAARRAIAASVDYDLSDGSVYRMLVSQVEEGIVPESDVDKGAARVLATKFRLGLFDNPFVDPDYAEKSPTAWNTVNWH